MDITETAHGATIILTPVGRIDQHSAPAFQAKLMEAIGRGDTVLDFGGVQYISSVGLRALMIGAKEIKASGRRLAVAALTPVVQEIFEISRFNMVLKVYDTLDAAVAGDQG